MKKDAVVAYVAARAQMGRGDAARAIVAVVDAIRYAVKVGGGVTLHGLGTFRVRESRPRVFWDVSRGAESMTRRGRRVSFQASRALRAVVQ